MTKPTCTHAASGCDYPAGECSGACARGVSAEQFEAMFEAAWEERRLMTWRAAGCHRDRGNVPSKEWGAAFKHHFFDGFLACARALEPKWQPIDTAPKTGRTLLLGYPNRMGNWRTVRGQWMSEAYIAECWEDPDDVEPGWFETAEEADDEVNCWRVEPTHWMPLPEQPTAAMSAALEDGNATD